MTKVLLDMEKTVLSIVQDYLNNNKVFDINKILPVINSQFTKSSININSRGIESILNSLMNKKVLVQGSTMSRADVLKNTKRNKLYQFIYNNPGKYLIQIEKKLKLQHHVAVWHLEILLKFDFIKKKRFDNHELFYMSEEKFENVKISYLIENNDSIVGYLNENNLGTTKTQLSRELDIHITTLGKRLHILTENNILHKENIDGLKLYFLNLDIIERF